MAAVSSEIDSSPARARYNSWWLNTKAPAIERNNYMQQQKAVLMPPQQSGPRAPFPQSNNYLPNGAPASGAPPAPTGVPAPGARPLDPNQGRVIQQGATRVLCVADVRGESFPNP